MMEFKEDFKLFLTERRIESLSELAEKNNIYANLIDQVNKYFKKVSDTDPNSAKDIETALKYIQSIEHEKIYELGFNDGVSIQSIAHPELNE